MNMDGKTQSRDALCQRIGHLAQLGGTRRVILNEGAAKGIEAIEVDTGAGLAFTVLPDRAMDISRAAYKGTNLVYLTPNGEVHPAYFDDAGLGWLRTFFGGLLTTCGLTYLGPPGTDGDDDLGLHGRYSTTAARQVQDRSGWDGDSYRIELSGTMHECRLFGDKLRFTRTIRTELGSRRLTIADEVENAGYATAPFTILYHINAGYPLLDAGSRLVLTAAKCEPFNPEAEKNFDARLGFSEPVPGFAEQNFLNHMKAAADGKACAAMLNPDLGIGLEIRFDPRELPYLNEWKMMGQADYVVGVEPCNVPCSNRAVLREQGQLPVLEPGEKRSITVEVGVLVGQQELNDCAQACAC